MQKGKSNSRGFTLIELMIVVVIIGILTSIGYPIYQDYVYKARRADAKAVLLEAAQYMERYYTENLSYNPPLPAVAPSLSDRNGDGVDDDDRLDAAPKGEDPANNNHFYDVAIVGPTATTYTLTATPRGNQVNDDCGTMTIDNTGATTPVNPDHCW
ncbi:MAG: type IV pilin protein [Candidatus Sedimenticola sp. 6PFRAG5]